jgi:DNA-binding HxlR family transcriptional regulator
MTPPSKVPGAILRELTNSPATVDGLLRNIPVCRRTLVTHLKSLRASGRIERVAVVADMRKPLYRRKVR